MSDIQAIRAALAINEGVVQDLKAKLAEKDSDLLRRSLVRTQVRGKELKSQLSFAVAEENKA